MFQGFVEIVHLKGRLDEVGLAANVDLHRPDAQRNIAAHELRSPSRNDRWARNSVVAHDRGAVQPVALLVGNLQERAALAQFGMLAQPFWQILARAARYSALDELVHAFGADLQFLVHGLANAVAHGEVGAHAERGQHHGQHREIPGGEPQPDGKGNHRFRTLTLWPLESCTRCRERCESASLCSRGRFSCATG